MLSIVLNYFKDKGIPYYKARSRKGYLRHLVVRKAYFTKELLVNLVTTTQLDLDLNDLLNNIKSIDLDAKLVGFLHTFNDSLSDVVQSDKTNILYGRDYIVEELLGLKFNISAFSFFQTNSQGAEKLYSIFYSKEICG